ncbi:MAG TPA: NAD-dependent epimerase/dehydratase family protein [Gammaproteobacteria bacterium]|jgi:nucleoside-diphosphate-sugar epimerase|nr:NAD-dependent epimerase/dehydratase family protein [Gammaproteobacteria bacterium]
MQKVLITGGAGFIGSHTARLLLEKNKEVVVLDNLLSGDTANLPLSHPHLTFIEGDILAYFLLEDLLKDCDAVLHLAAIPSVQQSIENPSYSLQVNTLGFLHVLQAIHKANRPIRLVYASSAAVYGQPAVLPCCETMLLPTALSPYALQKKHCEDYAALYKQLHGIDSLAMRYFNVYGAGQSATSPYAGVISRLIAAYHQDQPLTIYGDGQQSRDFIHISDIATANLLALESNYTGALNIATGTPRTLLEVVRCIASTGKPAELCFEPAKPGDIKVSFADTGLAKKMIGFQSAVHLSDGIQTIL